MSKLYGYDALNRLTSAERGTVGDDGQIVGTGREEPGVEPGGRTGRGRESFVALTARRAS